MGNLDGGYFTEDLVKERCANEASLCIGDRGTWTDGSFPGNSEDVSREALEMG
jgi:hypothetical protein